LAGGADRRRGMGFSFQEEGCCILNPKGRVGKERDFFSQLTPIPRSFRRAAAQEPGRCRLPFALERHRHQTVFCGRRRNRRTTGGSVGPHCPIGPPTAMGKALARGGGEDTISSSAWGCADATPASGWGDPAYASPP